MVMTLARHVGLEPRALQRLLQQFGTLKRLFNAERPQLEEIEGLDEETITLLVQTIDHLEESRDYIELLRQREISTICRFDSTYPEGLSELNDPPSLLFTRGKLPDPTRKRLVIVGTSSATNEGIELSVMLSAACAKSDIQVISSLRKGIDAAVHIGMHKAEGVSFAISETGLDEMPSEEIAPIAFGIIQNGGVMSEVLPSEEVGASGYYASNRLLAAIGQAVVVTEVYKDSTRTLDLLECCNEIGKLVFVLIDPRHGALSDETALDKAVSFGAIPMVGLDKIDDIFKSLV